MKNIIFLLLFFISCSKGTTSGSGRIPAVPTEPITLAEQLIDATTFVPFLVSKSIGTNILVDTDLEPFLDRFITEVNNYSYSLNQNFDLVFDKTLKGGIPAVLGHCDNGATPVVRINPYTWVQLSDTKKEILIFHELGHCLMGKSGHNDSNVTVNLVSIKESIMTTTIISETMYLDNRIYYLNEFFN